MKILIYAPLAVLGHHFETDLEIAERHLTIGDDVVFLGCEGQLKKLRFMACQGAFRCQFCVSRAIGGKAKLTQSPLLKEVGLGQITSRALPSDADLSSIQSIKNIAVDGIDIGNAYASSLISDLRDPDPDVFNQQAESLEVLQKMNGLITAFERTLNEVQPDLVYFFNGRFSIYRPLLRLCQKKNIKFMAHERGTSNTNFSLTEGNMPHDIATKTREIEQFWSESLLTAAEKEAVASSWFKMRSSGQMSSWISFTKDQVADNLPATWVDSRRNIAIYISSEDEFASVPGWELGLFISQSDAIENILRELPRDTGFHFYLRMHPNIRGLKNKSIDRFFELAERYENCEVISPESSVSSYSLLQKCEKVVCFGSTVGVEATFWGRPSILVGKSMYLNLSATHVPKSAEQLYQMIRDSRLTPYPREGALKYGYWASTSGVAFEYYKPFNVTTGKFKGEIISGNRIYMVMNYVFILLRDLRKVARGEYGWWHLKQKINLKLQGWRTKPTN